MRFVQRCLDSSGQRHVILFQKDCVIESEPVVGAPARLHCIFFQCSQTRRRFPGIPNTGSRARQLFDETPRQRGDSAKMRQKIQRGSFTGEDRAGISLDLHDLRTRFHKRPVVVRAGDPDLRIQCMEDHFGNRQSGANECLPGENMSSCRCSRWYHRGGSRISRADIFLQCTPYQVSDIARIPVHKTPKNYESFSSCDRRSFSFCSSMRCSASVASSPLMIISGARLRKISFPSCFSFEIMAFWSPSISFFNRAISACRLTTSANGMRSSNSAVLRKIPSPRRGSNVTCKLESVASRCIASRFSLTSSLIIASLLESSAAIFFFLSSCVSVRIVSTYVIRYCNREK